MCACSKTTKYSIFQLVREWVCGRIIFEMPFINSGIRFRIMLVSSWQTAWIMMSRRYPTVLTTCEHTHTRALCGTTPVRYSYIKFLSFTVGMVLKWVKCMVLCKLYKTFCAFGIRIFAHSTIFVALNAMLMPHFFVFATHSKNSPVDCDNKNRRKTV